MVHRSSTKKDLLPVGISTKGGVFLPFEKIHKIFSKTNYGYILKNRVRWGEYKPPEYTNGEWELILGPDANNLDHLLVAYDLMRRFLNKNKTFEKKDQEILLFTAIAHDWAEPAVGDIMRYLKTPADDDRELALLKNVLSEVLGSVVDVHTIRKVCDILRDKDSYLGKAFNAVEIIGYFETAFVAWETSKGINDGDLKLRLQWLMSNVLLADMSRFIQLAGVYQSVEEFLNQYGGMIDEAFKDMPKEVFNLHRSDRKEYYMQKFNEEKTAWRAYNK